MDEEFVIPPEPTTKETILSAIGSAVKKGREVIGGIREARDELYGYNGKGGLGIKLKPVEEMEFLPGGMNFSGGAELPPGLDPKPKKRSKAKEQCRDTRQPTVIEIHNHYHGNGKTGKKKKVVVKAQEKKRDVFADPNHIPDSLKDFF